MRCNDVATRDKLSLTWRLLQLRQRRAAWFASVGCEPVTVRGTCKQSGCAYFRSSEGSSLFCVVTFVLALSS